VRAPRKGKITPWGGGTRFYKAGLKKKLSALQGKVLRDKGGAYSFWNLEKAQKEVCPRRKSPCARGKGSRRPHTNVSKQLVLPRRVLGEKREKSDVTPPRRSCLGGKEKKEEEAAWGRRSGSFPTKGSSPRKMLDSVGKKSTRPKGASSRARGNR